MFFKKKKKVAIKDEGDMNKNIIDIEDENGNNISFEPVGTFKLKETKKEYLIFEEVNKKGEPKMLVTSYTFIDGNFDVKMITDEEELELVSIEANKILNEVAKKKAERTN